MNDPYSPSPFKPHFLFQNGDAQTILSSTARRVSVPDYSRIRLDTPDNDFIDIDVVVQGSPHLAIVLHGLEGSSGSKYMRGMVHALSNANFDVAAKNFRGCSGEPNSLPHSYHSGSSHDLKTVVDFFSSQGSYRTISLVGFSLGGNVLLKYLGELASDAPSTLTGAVALSVPVDLESCAYRLALGRNKIYMNRFLRLLKEKISLKAQMFPGKVSMDGFESLKSFADFDGRYVAPLNGFKDAVDYWTRSSSLPLLSEIRIPTLLINAADDPFLSKSCYPERMSDSS